MGVLLKNKNILVMGVRNKWSIAWGIVKAAQNEGANIIITYQGEREKAGAEKLGADSVFQCDISSDEEIDGLFSSIEEKYGKLHGLVHCIAHANTEDLQNDFIYTSRDGFAHALDVSAYSLVAVSQRAKNIMPEGAAILTLTYMGSEKVINGYNIMGVAKAALETSVKYLAYNLGSHGIRINAISAGPVKTLSAKGIKNFGSILDTVPEKAPLKRNITQEDLGKSALYLLSDMSSGTTGEIIHVDSGFNIMGI
ncbi:MAG: SDR family oxidoreductase [Clostridium sp.]|nr:SDR family oxidoreductase [Clostridium sp.]